ncbi:MAG: hypothetical protein EOO75_12650, partial [Myxococcales bacterium]
MTSAAARLAGFFSQRPRRELATALERDEPAEVRQLRRRGDAFLDEAERLRVLAEPLPEGTPPRARPLLEAQAVRCYVHALGPGLAWDELPLALPGVGEGAQAVGDAGEPLVVLGGQGAVEDGAQPGLLGRGEHGAAGHRGQLVPGEAGAEGVDVAAHGLGLEQRSGAR